jgi:hypothetical protein
LYKEQGSTFSGTSTVNSNTTKVNFVRPFQSIICTLGGFVKTAGKGAYGQSIFQNGNTTLTTSVMSLPAYSSTGAVNHSTSVNTGYWYASGY